MKKIFLLLAALAFVSNALEAQRIIQKSLPLSDVKIDCTDSRFAIDMDIHTKDFRASKDREFVITPMLRSADGADSVVFEPVIISGRNLYYRHLRNDDLFGTPMYQSGKSESIHYTAATYRQPWMDNADVVVLTVKTGCCAKVEAEYTDPIARLRRVEPYVPVFNYIHPVADSIKSFEISGSAYVNFPVNRTELYPDYMNNPAELRKITGTIDSVRNDPDITITSITIKGFASPEGSYENNVRLAKGRTATLTDYVERLYNFPRGFIGTDYLPEDWPGLRDYVKKSDLPNRAAILDIIDSPLPPDPKNDKLKRDFPEQYKFLLANVYPWLRHSDYRIEYKVRTFTSLEDILRVLKTAPQKLSKEEFFRAAQSMEPGSEEYNQVFETAVLLNPDDEVCNLNAGIAAMQRGNYAQALSYLNKAGEGPEVVYARGVLAAMQHDWDSAETYFARAAKLKVADAPAALAKVRELKEHSGGVIEIIKD